MQYKMRNKEKTISSKYYFTYKGKKLDKLTKTREEKEVLIENIQNMKYILKELGFREVLTVIKKRELYEIQFNGKLIEILIDFIPVLESYFLELELIVESLEKVESARNTLFNLLNKLGLRKEESISKSYLELIMGQS
jgi:adenylate cyclase class 2